MRIWGLAIIGSLFLFQAPARANVGESYGYGSRSSALGGAGVAWGFDAYSAYTNPSALAVDDRKRLVMSMGMLYMQPSFKEIKGIVLENDVVSDKYRVGDVENDYPATLGTLLGANLHLVPEWWNLSLGGALFFPMNQLAYLDSGETYVPEYALYRSRTQRPQVDVGVGVRPMPMLHFGAGLHLAYSLTSNASVYLQTTAGQPSSMRFATSMKPVLSPYFGALLKSDSGFSGSPIAGQSSSGSWTLAAVMRLPVESPSVMKLTSGAEALGSLAALDFAFTSNSAIYYDPLTIEVGFSYQHSPIGRFYLQWDYQFWSAYRPPALTIENSSGSTVQVNESAVPNFAFQNILIPRVGEELRFGKLLARIGYAYRPSFMGDVPTEAGNYLDPPKHMITVGAGYQFDRFLGMTTPVNVDVHLSYHHLVAQTVTKSAGDESGGSGSKVGSPGYETGGNVFGGGVSMTLAF